MRSPSVPPDDAEGTLVAYGPEEATAIHFAVETKGDEVRVRALDKQGRDLGECLLTQSAFASGALAFLLHLVPQD